MANRRTTELPGAHDGRVDVQKGVHQLARSVKHIQVSLRRAERKIEADARDRIGKLRHDARAQLAVFRGHLRDASRIVRRLSSAADDSWGDLKRAADRALRDGRKVADSMLKRFGAPSPSDAASAIAICDPRAVTIRPQYASLALIGIVYDLCRQWPVAAGRSW
jgi:hypothetical protein